MSEATHTPTPWDARGAGGHEKHGQYAIYGESGKTVAIVYDGAKDAAFIARAVNNHAALVTALESFIAAHDERYVSAMADDRERTNYDDAMDLARAAIREANNG